MPFKLSSFMLCLFLLMQLSCMHAIEVVGDKPKKPSDIPEGKKHFTDNLVVFGDAIGTEINNMTDDRSAITRFNKAISSTWKNVESAVESFKNCHDAEKSIFYPLVSSRFIEANELLKAFQKLAKENSNGDVVKAACHEHSPLSVIDAFNSILDTVDKELECQNHSTEAYDNLKIVLNNLFENMVIMYGMCQTLNYGTSDTLLAERRSIIYKRAEYLGKKIDIIETKNPKKAHV